MMCKIIPKGNLESVMLRLNQCTNLLNVTSFYLGSVSSGAVGAAADLLECICSELQMTIDTADDCEVGPEPRKESGEGENSHG